MMLSWTDRLQWAPSFSFKAPHSEVDFLLTITWTGIFLLQKHFRASLGRLLKCDPFSMRCSRCRPLLVPAPIRSPGAV